MKNINFIIENIINDIINEAKTGFLNLKEGTLFYNEKENIELKFLNVYTIPANEGLLENEKKVQEALTKTLEPFDVKNIVEVNDPYNSAIVVVMLDDNEKVWAFVKYFPFVNKSTIKQWSLSLFRSETGFEKVNKSVKKTITKNTSVSFPLKPQDLVGDEKIRDLSELKQKVLSNAKALVSNKSLPKECYQHINIIFDAIEKNEVPVLPNAVQYHALYSKDLGEIFAPISLKTGWLATGDREKSEQALLKGDSYESLLILFPQGKSNPLTDSNLLNEEYNVGISSKAGSRGATPSIVSIANIINDLNPETLNVFQKKYPILLQSIKILAENNNIIGPILLAKELQIIDEEEKNILLDLKNNIKMNNKEFKEKIKLTKNLSKLSKIIPKRPPVILLISGIALAIERTLNNMPETDEGLKKILEHGKFVQSRCFINKKGKDLIMNEFRVQYPPVFPGKIYFVSEDNYRGSQIKGKMGFRIK